MYPYQNKLRWWIRGRYGHLVDAVAQQPRLTRGLYGEQLAQRVIILRRWMLIRMIVLIILSFSVIAAVVSLVASVFSGTGELVGILRTLARISTILTPLATLLYFLGGRVLGQAEIDALMLWQMQTRKQ